MLIAHWLFRQRLEVKKKRRIITSKDIQKNKKIYYDVGGQNLFSILKKYRIIKYYENIYF